MFQIDAVVELHRHRVDILQALVSLEVLGRFFFFFHQHKALSCPNPFKQFSVLTCSRNKRKFFLELRCYAYLGRTKIFRGCDSLSYVYIAKFSRGHTTVFAFKIVSVWLLCLNYLYMLGVYSRCGMGPESIQEGHSR